MSVDFPNSPTNGTVHEQEGGRWVYTDPPGAWVVSGTTLQEYHDPAGTASWRIVGTTLECWGTYTVTGAPSAYDTITFPKTFAAPPMFTGTNLIALMGSVSALSRTASSCTFCMRKENGTSINGDMMWHAIGEWSGT